MVKTVVAQNITQRDLIKRAEDFNDHDANGIYSRSVQKVLPLFFSHTRSLG